MAFMEGSGNDVCVYVSFPLHHYIVFIVLLLFIGFCFDYVQNLRVYENVWTNECEKYNIKYQLNGLIKVLLIPIYLILTQFADQKV